ncbi:MAG: alpha-2-macroglobulin family protein [Proteobacteria bacterium]|nr:alpha-2-macroglobulin family protein [Pseudomonadota bacterium]
MREQGRGRGVATWLRVSVAALLVTTLALLGGCKPASQSTNVPALQGANGAPIDARQSPKGFTLLSAYPDGSGDELAIALEFTRPLVGTQDFDALVSVTDDKGAVVKGSWSLKDADDDDSPKAKGKDAGSRVLRFPGVKPALKYTVKIDGKLAAADGSTIGTDIQREVYTGPLDPVVGFASQGSVLPARETRGLPVVSVNVPEVDVEFFRVHDQDLSTFYSQYQRGGQKDGYDLDAAYGNRTPIAKMADSVYLNRFVLGGKENERVLNYLPIQKIDELSKPGLYFAVMKPAGHFKQGYQTALFFVSDIGLHVRAYKDKLFVHTASLQTGAPVGAVDVQVLDKKGNAVVKASTDASGNALIAYTLDSAQVLVARRGTDTSMLPFNQPALDLSEFEVAGRKQAWFDVFAWSGRDLYRPGETVRLSALMRDYDGKPVKPQPLFLVLKQPDGREFMKSRLDPRELGYYAWVYTIPADAPTGRWQVEFRATPDSKDVVEAMTLRVEEFLPERMKLDLDAAQPILRPGQPLQLKATAAYLYGAPADGNRFTARLAVSADQHPFQTGDTLPGKAQAAKADAYKGWFFGDPTISLPKEAKDVVDGSFDAQGHFSEDIDLPEEAVKVKAPVSVVLSGSVYETGGRTVTRTLKRTLWPADALVAVRPMFDDADGASPNGNAGFEVIRVDASGKRVAGAGLKVNLVREYRDYLWRWNDNTWDYDYTSRFDTITTKTVDVGASSSAKVDFPVEWGEYRLEVLDPATGLVSRYPFKAGWSWDDQNRGLDARPDKVKLALDKTAYKAGDTLKVTLTPPQPGKGVLLVESDHLLYTANIDAKPGATFEIPVTADWERHDVYLTALVFRGGAATEKTTPARAVGEAFIPMDRSARTVPVSLSAPAQMLPERDLPVTIKAPQLAGKQAYVTVSAVDVGILNITRFPVPDPVAYFFAQRRLGVDAYDIYGRVIEAFEGGTAKLRFGGDMALGALPQARRPTAHVQTVDLFSGPVALDAAGNATVPVKVPDFNGTLRVSTVVYSEDRYGKADTQTLVRAPVVVEVSSPRVLAPGDASTLTVDVQNFTGAAHEFTVSADGSAPLRIDGGARKLSLKDGAKGTLDFALAANPGNTVGKYAVTVVADGIKVERHYEVAVRPAWPAVVRSRVQVMQVLAPISLDTSDAVGMMADSVNVRLTLSALPPLPFASALAHLLEYPYGCIEQTTSKGWAALLLDADTARKLGMTGLDAAERKRRVEGAFGRIASMQLPNGNFSFWGGNSDAVPQMTPYVVEFLLDAREAGFAVPEGVLQKALERLSGDLLSGGEKFYGYEQADGLRFGNNAYAGYVLARVNRAPLGTLRAMYDNDRSKAVTPLSLVRLGVALDLMGDHARGGKAVADGFAMKSKRPWYLGDYGSDLGDLASMVTLVHRFHLDKPAYDERIFDLARDTKATIDGVPLNQRWWYLSTHDQIALAGLGKVLIAESDAKVSGTLSIGGSSETIAPQAIVSRNFDVAALRQGVRFVPTGKPPLYALIDVAGVPSTAPAPDDKRVSIERTYYTTDGKEWKGGNLREGDALIVGLKIESREKIADALIEDLLPAGVEIENFNLGDAKQWADVVVDGITLSDRSSAATVKHEEFRDDRYVAALSLDKGDTAHVFYLVRAVTPGTYAVPPPLLQDMYRPQIRGIGKSSPATIKVVQPK